MLYKLHFDIQYARGFAHAIYSTGVRKKKIRITYTLLLVSLRSSLPIVVSWTIDTLR